MCKKLVFLIILGCVCLVAKAQEEVYYSALDSFLENPSPTNFELLVKTSDSGLTPNPESHLAKVIVDCNIAYHFQRQGLLQEAISRYEDAITRYTEHSLQNYDIVTYAMIPLGNLYTKTNAYEEAANMIKGYITLSRKQNNTQNLLAGLINLSIPLQNQGKYKQAIAILNEARTLAPDNIDIQINLATNFMSTGNYSEAKEIATKVLQKDSTQINAYKLLSQIALFENNSNKAIAQLEQAISIQKKLPKTTNRDIAKTLLILAQTHLANKEYNDAKNQLDKIYSFWVVQKPKGQLPSEKDLIAENTLIDALDLHAQILLQEQKPQQALKAYTLASRVFDLLNNPFLSQQSRLLLATNDKKRNEAGLEILYNLYKDSDDNAFIELALAISDRSKSSLLSEATNDNAFLNKYQQDILVQKVREQEKTITQLERQLLEYKNSNNLSALEKTQNLYATALLSKKKIRESIAIKYPEIDQAKKPVELGIIRKKVTSLNHTVVSYFFGFKSVYQFIIGPETLDFVRLASDKETRNLLFKSCTEYNTYFTTASAILNNPTGYSQESHKLYKELNLPRENRLVIIPDGILSFTPFNTLLVEVASDANFETMPFLVKESQVSWQLSIHEYLRPNSTFSKKPNVLGVFPVFENTDLALTYSRDEARGIENTLQATILMDTQATVAQTFAQASRYTILHFSTHASGGNFNLSPSLAFTDRPMYLNELYSKNLAPDLVVLSACETGVGRIATGEGTLHLARGFQYAGAKSALFSLWKVNDKATAQLMEAYYLALKNTNSRDLSLHDAQIAYLTNTNLSSIKKSPYYWGAFVYYGPSDSAIRYTPSFWWWLLGIFGVFLLLLFTRKYGKS